MGSGKSSVGLAVAARLGLPFVDSDIVIEERHGAIPAIFASQGEAGFRELERDVVLGLLSALKERPLVLSLGGGAVTDAEVRAALRAARVVWLTAPPDVLWGRVTRAEAGPMPLRPLAGDEAAFRRLFAQRETLYRGVADVAIDADRPLADVVDDVVASLKSER